MAPVARRLPVARAVRELGRIVREPQRVLDVRKARVVLKVLDVRRDQADRDDRAAEKVLDARSDPAAPAAPAVSAGQNARRATVVGSGGQADQDVLRANAVSSAGAVDQDARRVNAVDMVGPVDQDVRRVSVVDMVRVRIDRRVPVVRKPLAAPPGSKAARRPDGRPEIRIVRRDETKAVPEAVVGSLGVVGRKGVRDGPLSAVAPIPAGDPPAALKTVARTAAAESANHLTGYRSRRHPALFPSAGCLAPNT